MYNGRRRYMIGKFLFVLFCFLALYPIQLKWRCWRIVRVEEWQPKKKKNKKLLTNHFNAFRNQQSLSFCFLVHKLQSFNVWGPRQSGHTHTRHPQNKKESKLGLFSGLWRPDQIKPNRKNEQSINQLASQPSRPKSESSINHQTKCWWSLAQFVIYTLPTQKWIETKNVVFQMEQSMLRIHNYATKLVI